MFSTALTAPGRTRLGFHATRVAIVPPSAANLRSRLQILEASYRSGPAGKALHCSHRPTQEPDCQELRKHVHSLQSISPTVLSHLGAESHISMHMCEWRQERDRGRAAPTVGGLQQPRWRMMSWRLHSFHMISAGSCSGWF